MNCRLTQANFDERLDGRLDAARGAAFDEHLAHCARCAAEWRAYQAAWALLGRHVAPSPSAGFVERTLRRIDEIPLPKHTAWLPLWRWVTTCGLAIALAATGWLAWLTKQRIRTDAQVELYVMAHQDRLEDFDVVAVLHLLDTEHP
ncbi:MAG: zf-HC2 domain-containing protein [Verrucomicrobiae bacterium]|nr:zf-HC2 domain-containing protein [Verrucomicrobiae bacterium]